MLQCNFQFSSLLLFKVQHPVIHLQFGLGSHNLLHTTELAQSDSENISLTFIFFRFLNVTLNIFCSLFPSY